MTPEKISHSLRSPLLNEILQFEAAALHLVMKRTHSVDLIISVTAHSGH
jgi:hypothetical protein